MYNFFQQEHLKALLNNNIAFANETITVSSGLTSKLTVPTGADYCLITVEASTNADGIRFWVDGIAPTSTDGILRKDGSGFDIKSASNMSKFTVYGVGNGAVLQVQYYR